MIPLLPILIQCLTIFSSTAKNEEIHFIREYILEQRTFYSVTAFLCWDKENRYLLANEFMISNITNIVKNAKIKGVSFPLILNQMYVVDLSCENTTKILEYANEDHAFRPPNHWLLLNTSSNKLTPNKYKLLKNIDVFINSKFVVVQKTAEGQFHLDYLYKMNRTTSEVISYEFANYTNCKIGVQYYRTDEIVSQRKNLNLYKFRIGAVIMLNRSYAHLTDYRYNEEDSFTKANIPLLYLMIDYVNATFNMTFSTNWYNVGTNNQTGSLLGKIISGEVDMSATPYFCLQDRLKYFDCIALTTPVNSFFMYRRPPLSYVKNIYVLPFGNDLWLTDLAFYLISAIFLYIIVVWEWKILQETKQNPDFDMIHSTFSDMLLFTMGAVCQQGYATEPKGTPGKILILTIFITLIFLFTAYSAYIVVLFQATSDDIKTLKDLYESNIVLGVEDQHYFKLLFSTANDDLRKKIYSEKIIPIGQKPHFYSRLEGIERVRKEYFAFCVENLSGYKLVNKLFFENEKCGLQEIKFSDDRCDYSYLINPKNNSFKETFKTGYAWMIEVGLFKRELKRRIDKKPTCNSEGNNFRVAGLIDLYSIYMVLISGSVTSFFMLFFEMIAHRLLEKYKLEHHVIMNK